MDFSPVDSDKKKSSKSDATADANSSSSSNNNNTRNLMDSGEGPPFLGVNSHVLRGPDWSNDSSSGDDDGRKKILDAKKENDDAKKSKWKDNIVEVAEKVSGGSMFAKDEVASKLLEFVPKPPSKSNKSSVSSTAAATAKVPYGTVTEVCTWNGVPALGRKVRWAATNVEKVYKYGGDQQVSKER